MRDYTRCLTLVALVAPLVTAYSVHRLVSLEILPRGGSGGSIPQRRVCCLEKPRFELEPLGGVGIRNSTIVAVVNESSTVQQITSNKPSWWKRSKQWWSTRASRRSNEVTATNRRDDQNSRALSAQATNLNNPMSAPRNKTRGFETTLPLSSWRVLNRNAATATLTPALDDAATNRSLIEAWSLQTSKREPTERKSSTMGAFTLPGAPLVSSLRLPDDALTLADLQRILLENDFVRRSELQSPTSSLLESRAPMTATRIVYPKVNGVATAGGTKSGVAFPQSTALLYSHLLWSTTLSGFLLGLTLLASASPSLWLLGALAGALLGYDTVSRRPSPLASTTLDAPNVLQQLLLACGRRLARLYLQSVDAGQAFFFMYKTGQLSYEYYKRYAVLDERFALQQKMDAWNARFVQGKLAFDQWERQNEVGRKLLAGIRTAWLVEERSQKKRRLWLLKRNQTRQSRYRIVQVGYDAMFTVTAAWRSLERAVVGTNVRELVRGLWMRGRTGDGLNRVQSSVAAVATIYCLGALWTRSPLVAAVLVATMAWLWPTWLTDTSRHVETALVETRALGRGETAQTKSNQWLPRRSDTAEKARYHFFRTMDGQKRFYRVGQPWFGAFQTAPNKSRFSSLVSICQTFCRLLIDLVYKMAP